jgi:membrane protease YdiL (CAAX protease family)
MAGCCPVYGDGVSELLQGLTAVLVWAAIAAGPVVLATGVWRRWPGARRLLDQRPVQPVPWSGAEVYAIVVAYFFLPLAVHAALSHAGFFSWLPGPEHMAADQGTDPSAPSALRRQLWVKLASDSLLVVFALLVTGVVSRTRPAHLGLTVHQLGTNLRLGILAGLLCTPLVNLLYATVSWILTEGLLAPPESHPFTQLAAQGLTPLEWIVVFVSASLVGPVLEELLFRGVLQRYLATRSWGGDAAMIAALAMALLTRLTKIQAACSERSLAGCVSELAPALFVLALVPVYWLVRQRSQSSAASAIFGTAVLFAAVHSFVWPTPIPLFVLGLALGLLAQRRQSLVPPLVVHMIFNATACGVLLLSARW